MENSGLTYTILSFFSGLSGPVAYVTILGILIACGFGLPIPEDITLIAAGILVSLGKISYLGAYVICFAGILIGDGTLFFLGRKYGRRCFTWPVFRKIFTPEVIKKSEDNIQKNARWICFVARFLPGLRAPIYLSAGILQVRPATFLIQDGLAALISVPVWIELGRFAGENLDQALAYATDFKIIIFAAVAAFIIYILVKKFLNRNSKLP